MKPYLKFITHIQSTLLLTILFSWYTANAQDIQFTEVIGTPFDAVEISSIAFGDVDNDNDLDVLITGSNGSQPIAKLYLNDGTGSYTEQTGTPFEGVSNSSIAFADVNNDNNLDVLITGITDSSQRIAKLYQNNGLGSFTEVTDTPFDGVVLSSIAFADVNNDNYLDVLITGQNNSSQSIAKLYENNGSGNFTEVTGTPFAGVRNSSIAFADIDNDSDPDVLITGRSGSGAPVSILYENNGLGSFSEISGTPFAGVYYSSIAFADIDNDNYPDVFITGRSTSNQRIARLYENNGEGNFTEVEGTPFMGVDYGSTAFADVDSDNDPDIVMTGSNSSFQYIVRLYKNNGSGNFTEIFGMPFEGVVYSSIAFADVDNDNDPDILITGSSNTNQRISKLYSNTTCTPTFGTDTQTACNSYTWIDGNTYTSSNNTETYTLTNAAGCDSVVMLNLTINSVSDTTTTTNGLTISANNNGATYQWLNCSNNYAEISGQTGQNFTATSNGNYAVELSENGCVDTTACVAITTVGIIENKFGEQLKVFPNPTDGNFSIDLGAVYPNSKITISDVSGRLISETNMQQAQILNLSIEKPSGIYFIQVQAGDKKALIRLVKE